MKSTQLKTTAAEPMCGSAQTASSVWRTIPPRADLGQRLGPKAVPGKTGRQFPVGSGRKPLVTSRYAADSFELSLPLNSPLRAIPGIESVVRSYQALGRAAVLFAGGQAGQPGDSSSELLDYSKEFCLQN